LQSLEKLFEGVHFRRGYDLAFSSTPSGALAVQVGGTEVTPFLPPVTFSLPPLPPPPGVGVPSFFPTEISPEILQPPNPFFPPFLLGKLFQLNLVLRLKTEGKGVSRIASVDRWTL
jgi:hypothetical protein